MLRFFPQKRNGSDWVPFVFVFLWPSGGSLVWEGCFAGSVLFRATHGIGPGCKFFPRASIWFSVVFGFLVPIGRSVDVVVVMFFWLLLLGF